MLGTLILGMTNRQEEDLMMTVVAGVLFVASLAAIVGGVSLLRRKQNGLAVLLFVGAGGALLGCLGISALLFLAQFAWH